MVGVSITKQSKKLGKIKTGDKIFINDKPMRVDSHYLFKDHGNTKEMIIELFNEANEREYQIRYFDDQIETSLEVYELQGDFQYVRREPKSIGW